MGLMKELNALNDIYQNQMYESKKADKDYDGDGKIESGTDEYMGSRDKAIKKAMAKKGMKKEAYTVTNADKKGNTPAYQGYKAGKKNVKTGKPMYKAADHLKDDFQISPEVEKLIESGKFSEQDINLLVWNEFDENYQAMRNPEKYERDQEKKDKRSAREKRMADPKTGINSPAFKKFMASQGM